MLELGAGVCKSPSLSQQNTAQPRTQRRRSFCDPASDSHASLTTLLAIETDVRAPNSGERFSQVRCSRKSSTILRVCSFKSRLFSTTETAARSKPQCLCSV
jgi:hypothetical protein